MKGYNFVDDQSFFGALNWVEDRDDWKMIGAAAVSYCACDDDDSIVMIMVNFL